ncbi:MAG TPA: Crp/Fnr family transcriptional regulator [bacterium]|nr:Crp/Fnr family transcriptional regulator [bacterium]
MAQALADVILQVPAFAEASESQVHTLSAASRMRRVRAQELIYAPGEQDSCYIIEIGRAKLVLKVRNGDMFLHLVRPGELFGTESFWEVSPHVFAIAVEPCSVVQIRGEAVRRFLEASPEACMRLMQQGAFAQRLLLDRMQDMVTLSVPQRLVRFLIFLGNQYGIKRPDGSILIDVGLTHQDLGVSVGTGRETATTLLNDLKAEGLLVIGRKMLTLLDASAMLAKHGAPYLPMGQAGWSGAGLLSLGGDGNGSVSQSTGLGPKGTGGESEDNGVRGR